MIVASIILAVMVVMVVRGAVIMVQMFQYIRSARKP